MIFKLFDQRAVRYQNRVQCSEMLPRGYVTDLPFKRCDRRATYTIDGKPYCTLHAGKIALEVILNKQKE